MNEPVRFPEEGGRWVHQADGSFVKTEADGTVVTLSADLATRTEVVPTPPAAPAQE